VSTSWRVCLLVLWASPALAQSESAVDLQLYRPAAGALGLLGTASGETSGHLATRLALDVDWMRKPMQLTIDGSRGVVELPE